MIFLFCLKIVIPSKLKIRLQLGKVDISKNKAVGLRIMNPYNNDILRVKHIKYIKSEK